jgi:hypothetical protein
VNEPPNPAPTLDDLLDPVRGEKAPHPLYAASESDRKDLVELLRGLDDTSK